MPDLAHQNHKNFAREIEKKKLARLDVRFSKAVKLQLPTAASCKFSISRSWWNSINSNLWYVPKYWFYKKSWRLIKPMLKMFILKEYQHWIYKLIPLTLQSSTKVGVPLARSQRLFLLFRNSLELVFLFSCKSLVMFSPIIKTILLVRSCNLASQHFW